MTKLRELYDSNPSRYNSDKGNYHSYVDYYGKLFEPYKEKYKRILEVGVLDGGSLRLWADYFEDSSVTGIDIDPSCSQYNEKNISIHIGDSTTSTGIDESIGETVFDLILDDGSHEPLDQIRTFEGLYSRVVAGGIYIIEDIRIQELQRLKNHFVNYSNLEIEDRRHLTGITDEIIFTFKK
jgi:23S rRNA U2552 (ribose-2'-O)-methylase RlmE/FtsJ